MKPTIENAAAGFSGFIEQMKTQQNIWTNHLSAMRTLDPRDVHLTLRSAFFMQAIGAQQTLYDFHGGKKTSGAAYIVEKLGPKAGIKHIYQFCGDDITVDVYTINSNTVTVLEWIEGWLECFVFSFDKEQAAEIKEFFQGA